MPIVKPQQVECGAWVLSDQSGLRQTLLHELGFNPVLAIFHDLHSQEQFNRLSDQLNSQKPSLLWVRLAGPSCGSGNKRDNKRAEFLARLVLEQLRTKRVAILEGNVRSQGWNLRPIRELMAQLPHDSKHLWCRYQNTEFDPCNLQRYHPNFGECANCIPH